MGCGSSTGTAVVRPMVPGNTKADEDETGSKHSGRGDSAVSKCTTDSGVVMENREVPTLPGTVLQRLPPLSSAAVSPPLLRRDSLGQERQKSSDILEELLSQGIIPMGQSRESSNTAGEAYSIMLNEGDGALRRRPARLESLKANKAPLSKEDIDEKIRLAEERRKQKEDDMKSRLRAKSVRVRVPTRSFSPAEEEDPTEELAAPAQVSQSPAEGADREAEHSERLRNPSEEKETPAEVKERGENDVVPITKDGEVSDADSDISFQPATAQEEIF